MSRSHFGLETSADEYTYEYVEVSGEEDEGEPGVEGRGVTKGDLEGDSKDDPKEDWAGDEMVATEAKNEPENADGGNAESSNHDRERDLGLGRDGVYDADAERIVVSNRNGDGVNGGSGVGSSIDTSSSTSGDGSVKVSDDDRSGRPTADGTWANPRVLTAIYYANPGWSAVGDSCPLVRFTGGCRLLWVCLRATMYCLWPMPIAKHAFATATHRFATATCIS
jgi:hypothetical protein